MLEESHGEVTSVATVFSDGLMLRGVPGALYLAWACRTVTAEPDFDYLLEVFVVQDNEC